MENKTSGPAVSRALRAAGFYIAVDHQREGMRVRHGSGQVSVMAQFDSDTRAARLATEAADALRGLGFTVAQNGARLVVTKEGGRA